MKFVLLLQLRRDVMVGGFYTGDEEGFADACSGAVKQGRAQDAFMLELHDFATASNISWGNIDTPHPQVNRGAASIPPLNPENGEQESAENATDVEVVNIHDNLRIAAEEQPAGPGVNTGRDPEGKPTDPATLGQVPAKAEDKSAPAKKA